MQLTKTRRKGVFVTLNICRIPSVWKKNEYENSKEKGSIICTAYKNPKKGNVSLDIRLNIFRSSPKFL